MLKSIIHAGGESTRLREIFSGPKALAPIGDQTLLWFHMQPLVKSKIISEFIFTLRHQHETVEKYIEGLKESLKINACSIVEPRPVGRAGVVKLGIECGKIETDVPHLMSHPDDLIPIDVKELFDYSQEAERKGKSMVLVLARHAVNPFGIGVVEHKGDIIELKHFSEKPELPFIQNHYANTGMSLFLPDAMKEFEHLSLDKFSNPENEIVPNLTRENKVAVFLVDRWIPVNYSSEYKWVQEMGQDKLLEFLGV